MLEGQAQLSAGDRCVAQALRAAVIEKKEGLLGVCRPGKPHGELEFALGLKESPGFGWADKDEK